MVRFKEITWAPIPEEQVKINLDERRGEYYPTKGRLQFIREELLVFVDKKFKTQTEEFIDYMTSDFVFEEFPFNKENVPFSTIYYGVSIDNFIDFRIIFKHDKPLREYLFFDNFRAIKEMYIGDLESEMAMNGSSLQINIYHAIVYRREIDDRDKKIKAIKRKLNKIIQEI